MSPYRIQAARPARAAAHVDGEERGFALALGVFVVISAIRVAGAFARGEAFGTEPTLAFLVVVLGLARLGRAAGRALSA